MAKETVTRSARFYCVSLTPDICKTPVGQAVVPVPYTIKGEFSTAQAVSRNVKTHGEPLFLHGKSFIPKVTGDAQGTLGGIKSGTFLQKVESKAFSSTTAANALKTIQEQRIVYMNNRNTVGRVFEREVKPPRERLKPIAKRYEEKISPVLHEQAGQMLDASGKLYVGSALLGGAALGVAATGIGAPLAAAMGDVAATGASAATVVGAAGAALEVGATGMDMLASWIQSGQAPNAAKVAKDTAAVIVEKVILKRGATAWKWLKKLYKKIVPGKTPPVVQKNFPDKKGGGDKDGVDGGKVKKEKPNKGDKPADCCPKNTAPGGKSAKTKKPAHIGTGEEILHQVDFQLEGPTPLEWSRTYRSGSETEDGSVLGARWASPFTASLSVCASGLVYHDATGRAVRLPSIGLGEDFRSVSEGFSLRCVEPESYRLTWHDGSVDTFGMAIDSVLPHGYEGVNAMLEPRAVLATRRLRLLAHVRRDKTGFNVSWTDGAACGEVMLRVATTDGLVIEGMRAPLLPQELGSAPVSRPRVGRLEQVLADGTRVLQACYRYECEDSAAWHPDQPQPAPPPCLLVAHSELGGAVRSYTYRHQLLVSYVNYAGLAFHIDWMSLEALRARWAGDPASDDTLAARHRIDADNSYRARVVRTADAHGGCETTLAYLDQDTTRVTEADGGVFVYRFNASWLVTDLVRIDTNGTARKLGRRTWNRDDRLIAEIDAMGNDTRYAYDDAGNLTSVTDAKGQTTHIGFDEHNQPVLLTDPLGNTTTHRYDGAGRLLETRDPLGRVTRQAYDDRGRLHTIENARGGKSRLVYDPAGRLVEYVDCSNNATRFEYDSNHRQTASIDAAGNTTRRHYDARGRLTSLIHADGANERFAYDVSGNLLEHTDPKAMVTRFRYNGYNLPVERRDALGHTLRYRYDQALRLTGLVNQNGEIYTFAYDDDGNVASETGFDGKITHYRYDRAGHLTDRSVGAQQTQYARDALGQIQAIVNAGDAVRYAYDANGQLIAVSSATVDLRFIYDGAGQLIDERTRMRIPAASGSDSPIDRAFTLTHAYDELGNRIQSTLPNGRRIDTLRYGSGHWHGTLWQGRSVADLEHDRLHRETQRQLGLGSSRLLEERAYDPAWRLASTVLRSGTQHFQERQYGYDLAGNLITIGDTGRGLTSYVYDPVGQLLASLQPGLHETFAFDPAGNLIDPDASGEKPAAAASGERDEPIAPFPKVTHDLLQRYLGVSYTYDDAGNVLLRRRDSTGGMDQTGEIACAYDLDNQLATSCRTSGQHRVVAHYHYDPFGRRIAKQAYRIPAGGEVDLDDMRVAHADVVTTLFVWDGDTLLQEVQAHATTTYVFEPERFVPLAMISSTGGWEEDHAGSDAIAEVPEWLPLESSSEPCAHVRAWHAHEALRKEALHRGKQQAIGACAEQSAVADVLHYYVCDHLGTPLELRNDDGETVWSAHYRAWGGVYSNDVRAVAQPLRFQGQYEDAETGFHYNRFRYYDPHVGRFITQDPIGLGGGTNLYRYGPNPVWWVDPLGLAAGGGGVYIFETTSGHAYIGKGSYTRFGESIRQRLSQINKLNPPINSKVSRGIHMDTSSPCPKVFNEAEYAEMVEHEAMDYYYKITGARLSLNDKASAGRSRLDLNHSLGKKGIRCPGVHALAEANGREAVDTLLKRKIGSGKR